MYLHAIRLQQGGPHRPGLPCNPKDRRLYISYRCHGTNLIAGILKDKKNLEPYRNMIIGNILSIDSCKFVKEIEWHPKENSNVMEPYVFLYVTNEDEVPMYEIKTITDEDYRLIKEATFKAYGISNAKMFLDKLLLRKA